ncbi:MAG TPA: ABC transporter permease [Oligoflexia bacterium]|nr:ABC transporter permease [Oligoflexia bacterium]
MRRNIYEIWRYRALIWALVGRHLNARYRGSFLGFIWSFLNPLCLIAVYSLVFQYYIRFQDVEHYTLFLFAGLLPWIWFSSGLIEATGSISASGSLITKAMFPPHILPLVSVLTNLINFLFAVPLLVGFMFIVGVLPGVGFFMLPVVILIELLFLLGLSLALSALNVRYRDIQHILGNLMTLWFFLCPIIYPAGNVPERFRLSLTLNPVAVFTQMYHNIFIEGTLPGLRPLLITFGVSCITLCVGNWIFNRYREEFAELV